jgi:hypothetical protein
MVSPMPAQPLGTQAPTQLAEPGVGSGWPPMMLLKVRGAMQASSRSQRSSVRHSSLELQRRSRSLPSQPRYLPSSQSHSPAPGGQKQRVPMGWQPALSRQLGAVAKAQSVTGCGKRLQH